MTPTAAEAAVFRKIAWWLMPLPTGLFTAELGGKAGCLFLCMVLAIFLGLRRPPE